MARDRSGVTTDYVLTDNRKAAVMAMLKPLLRTDADVCSDGAGTISNAAKELGLEHNAVWALPAGTRWALGTSRTSTPTTHGSRPGCVASTAWPRTISRTISAGAALSTGCLATPLNPLNCRLWRLAADLVLG